MKLFSWRQIALFSFIGLLFLAVGCKDDDPTPVKATDFEVTMDENPEDGAEIGSVSATTSKGTLVFTLKSESVSGAFSLNTSSGELTVLDGAKFDFEAHPTLTAVVLVTNGETTAEVDVKVNLQKVIWEGEPLTFSKASNADWTLAANQDKISEKVIFTRQNKGPIYNYQFWQDNFEADATYDDLNDDFWDNEVSLREFTRSGGTNGVRFAILDDTGMDNTDAWDNFEFYGTLGDPAHFYSLHNIASMIYELENVESSYGVVTGVPDAFSVEFENGTQTSTDMPSLVGKKLGVWLVEEDIYFTLTFTDWGANGSNSVAYTRSTKD